MSLVSVGSRATTPLLFYVSEWQVGFCFALHCTAVAKNAQKCGGRCSRYDHDKCSQTIVYIHGFCTYRCMDLEDTLHGFRKLTATATPD